MKARNLIGRSWVAGGATQDVRNPADEREVVGSFVAATEEQAAAAVEAAAEAAEGWARTALRDRCASLTEIARTVAQRSLAEDWPTLLTREQGKILPESVIDVGFVSLLVEYCTQVADEVFAEERLEDRAGRRVRRRKPVGVVSAITPWNWPVTLSALKIIPALACGNTVVIKPAPTTPLTVTQMVEAMASVLPAGVVNVVHGGEKVGRVLTSHPAVRKISFTGSTRTGREVMRNAAETVKNVNLELGGNDAAILLDDVAIDEDVAEALVTAAFTTTGQVCMAVKRIFVHESRYEELIGALCDVTDQFVVGDGLADDSTMGPLNNRVQFDRVGGLLDDAARRGGKLLTLGRPLDPGGWDNGFFVRPTIVTGLRDDAPLVAEEQFGPALPVLPFSDDAEAVTRANRSEYGLCGSVWSADLDRAFALADELDAGVKFVNAHGLPALELSCPSGGMKQSGLGREFGVDGIREYTEGYYITNRLQ